MKNVIAVFDIGKTNKKILLFDRNFNVVFENTAQFKEIVDDDNYPCDDIAAIENWMKNQIDFILKKGIYNIKAVNFSTHGATLAYLDKCGKRITPLYNYLKLLDDFSFNEFYAKNGGIAEFCRKTASPAYGMLNAGLQIYWLKNAKPHYWQQVSTILHYPQYLSYLFSHKIVADYTSIGAHTAIWDFDNMQYHPWLEKENIKLPSPVAGTDVKVSTINGVKIAIGQGLHDSSASLIPFLEKNHKTEFILLSTGTWIISMNPFSNEKLTQMQLKNNCLCFMTPDKRQVKSSMQFLGHAHEVYALALCAYFGVEDNYYTKLSLNNKLCSEALLKSEKVFFPEGMTPNYKTNSLLLSKYSSYEAAYYQILFEICQMVFEAVGLILNSKNKLLNIYISGGFSKNKIFVHYLSLLFPGKKIIIPNVKNGSALGAALMMKDHFN